MTKVEELREHVVEEVVSDIKELATAWGDNEYLVKRKMQRMTSEIDALIAAVREDEREKCANYMLWRRDELEEAAGIDPKEGQHD